jgi:transcriptional activator SPT8
MAETLYGIFTRIGSDDSASYDNLRLYDLASDSRHGVPPFWIIPGHQSGTIASVCITFSYSQVNIDVDPTCRFVLTAGGNRGWGGSTTEVVIGYDIGVVG